MEFIYSLGTFIQTQILGMQWLNEIVGDFLRYIGIDTSLSFGGSIHFFIYDVIKILFLLTVLIFLISYIQSYFPPQRTKRILSSFRGFKANCLAALLGTVTPFCSCSSIPLFIGFTRSGLPLGVTFSFLISSPMVDLGSLVLLMSIFGVKIAFIYVIFGFVISVLGGSLIERLKLENEVEDYVRKGQDLNIQSFRLSALDRTNYAISQVIFTIKKVVVYVFIGVGIGAFIHNYIPEELIIKLLGDGNSFGVVIATFVGIPIYADIFGTIPIAEALLSKGAQLGVVVAFMMSVTTLSLPSLIMLRKTVKIKLIYIFISICTLGIVIVGYVFNLIAKFII